jgi:hypothetical protein
VITETCQVCFLSHTYEGKASDKSIAELVGYTLPAGSCLYQDKGFQGFVLPGITIVQPQKTPRGGELTPPEQAMNRRHTCPLKVWSPGIGLLCRLTLGLPRALLAP